MSQNENANGVQADSDYTQWVNRLGTLLTYHGPSTSGWFVNSEISDYPNGRAALCSVLSSDGFGTTYAG